MDYTKIFHTVPLTAKTMQREADGVTKTNPGFPKGGWTQYQTQRNTQNTALLGIIAGQDFIGVDIDTNELFNQVLGLIDDQCDYVARSDIKGGHLLFAYHQEDYELLNKIHMLAKKAKIDLQIGSRLIYLATAANKCKTLLTEPLTALPAYRIPAQLVDFIMSKALQANIDNLSAGSTQQAVYDTSVLDNSTLGYLLEQEYTEELVAKIVPAKLEVKNPAQLQDGEGTEWMNSVRFKLAQDPSVSEEKFQSIMLYINTLWDNPMDDARIIKDCNYDVKNRINSITGDNLWRYNKDWKHEGMTYPTVYGDTIEIMYDSAKELFVEYNNRLGDTTLFNKQTSLVNSIISNSKDRRKITGEMVLKKAEPVEIIDSPEANPAKTKPHNRKAQFNLFRPTDGVLILKGIKIVKEPIHPENTLKFFENLIPDQENRERLFGFLANKHTTYEYTPLYFVLAGVGGAGKGVFTTIYLEYFAGLSRIQEVTLDKLQNNFNAWMASTDYAIIDEGGEGESKAQQAKLVAELKKRTGRAVVSIEKKGKDILGDSNTRHYITPVITTNMNTKLITDTAGNDRRLVLFKCPNKLSTITNNTKEFIASLHHELPHFANYLKTFKKISHTDYTDNKHWKNDDYEEYIESTTDPIDKIVEALEDSNLDKLMQVFTEDLCVPLHEIDRLFSTSTGSATRILLYNTSGTKELDIPSLVDIAESTSLLDPIEVKTKLRKMKKKVSFKKGNKNYSIQVVELLKAYKHLVEVETIAPLELDE